MMATKRNLKNLGRRGLSLFMAMVMSLSLIQISAFAANPDVTEQSTKQIIEEGGTFYYDKDGNMVNSLSNGDVSVSKTVKATGDENKFQIHLEVATTQDLRELSVSPDAAVMLVMDTSNSMVGDSAMDTIGGVTKERLAWAKDAANTFLQNYVQQAGDSKRMVSIVEFGSNAKTVLPWTEANSKTTNSDGTTVVSSGASNGVAAVTNEFTYYDGCNQTGLHTHTTSKSMIAKANLSDWNWSSGLRTTCKVCGIEAVRGNISHNHCTFDGCTQPQNTRHTHDITTEYAGPHGTSQTDSGGTNIEGGLMLARNLILNGQQSDGSIHGIENLYVILLTDGVPTYNVSNSNTSTAEQYFVAGTRGGGSTATYNDAKDVPGLAMDIKATAGAANSIQYGAKLYSLVYGNVSGSIPITSNGNNTQNINTWLTDTVMVDHNYPSSAGGDIDTNLGNLGTIIGTLAQAWNVTDPMPTSGMVTFSPRNLTEQGGKFSTGNSSYLYYWDATKNQLTWDLKQEIPTQSGNIFTYTLDYEVFLNTEKESFVPETEYLTSTGTQLSYLILDANEKLEDLTVEQVTGRIHSVDFDTPSIQGYRGAFDFMKIAHHKDAQGKDIYLGGAPFQLTNLAKPSVYKTADTIQQNTTSQSDAENETLGKVAFANIPSGYIYTMSETDSNGAGTFTFGGKEYALSTATWPITVKYGKVMGAPSPSVENTIKQHDATLTLTKTWQIPSASSTQPILVDVKQDGATIATLTLNGSTCSSDNSTVQVSYSAASTATQWIYKLTVPCVNQETGGDYLYTTEEHSLGDGYTTTYSPDTLSITNTTTGKTSVTVEKQWLSIDGAEMTSKPAVQVILTAATEAGSKKADKITLPHNGSWAYTFNDLDAYDQGKPITYSVSESNGDYQQVGSVTGTGTSGNPFVLVNTVLDSKINVPVSKTWNDGNSSDRPNVTVELLRDGISFPEGSSTTYTLTSADVDAQNKAVWTHTFSNLSQYSFTRDNSNVITGVHKYEYSLKELSSVPGYTTSTDNLNVTNTRAQDVSITVRKAWVDTFESHDEVTIALLKNGTQIDSKTTENGVANFSKLPQFDPLTGAANTYTIQELSVPADYTVSYDYGMDADQSSSTKVLFNANHEGVVTVTNTLNTSTETVQVQVTKQWQHPDGTTAPDVTFTLAQLDADTGVVNASFDTKTLTATDGTTATFENLPKFYYEQVQVETGTDEAGAPVYKTEVKEHEYQYSVTEAAIPGYNNGQAAQGVQDTANPNQWTFTNTITGTMELTVEKQWQGLSGTTFPTATITLMRTDGTAEYEAVSGKELVTNTNESATWTVDKYSANGQLYTYKVVEASVGNYTTAYAPANATFTDTLNKVVVTNTLTQDATYSFTATKTWADNSNVQNTRKPITLTLYQVNGSTETVLGTVIIDAKGTQTGGTYTGTVNVTATTKDQWSVQFSGLTKYAYADGSVTQYSYKVAEAAVDGYTTHIVNDKDITNTLTQGTTSISLHKNWVDPANQAHPNVTFTLTAKAGNTSVTSVTDQNGKSVTFPQTVTLGFDQATTPQDNAGAAATATSDNWYYTWNNLPKYDNQQTLITYLITEGDVAGYDSVSHGNGSFTNTIKQENLDFDGQKIWDLSNQTEDDVLTPAPQAVSIALYYVNSDGSLGQMVSLEGNPATVTPVTGADGVIKGSFDFQDLPRYDSSTGEALHYTVREVAVTTSMTKAIGYSPIAQDGTISFTVAKDGATYSYNYTVGYAVTDRAPSADADAGTNTTVTNTYQDPDVYFYQILGNYYTNLSGNQIHSETGVNLTGTPTGYCTLTPEQLADLGSNTITPDTNAFAQHDGLAFVFDSANPGNVVSVTLDRVNHMYTIQLNYVRNLYSLTVNYVFENSADKPSTGFESYTAPNWTAPSEGESYTDPGSYLGTDSYGDTFKAAPTAFKITQVTVKNSEDAAQTVANNYNGGIFANHDVLVTYHYARNISNPDVPQVTDPEFTIRKINAEDSSLITHDGATFQIYSDAACETPVAGKSFTTSSGIKAIQASDLGEGTWYLKESQAPQGYTSTDTVWKIVVGYSETLIQEGDHFVNHQIWTLAVTEGSGADSALSDGILLVPNARQYGYLTITKTVSGLEKTSEQHAFKFSVTGSNYGTSYTNNDLTISVTGNSTASLTAAIKVPTGSYLVIEDSTSANIGSGYEVSTSYSNETRTVSVSAETNNTADSTAGITVFNAYTYGGIDTNIKTVTGKKLWSDDSNRDGLRPASIRVQLMNNDIAVAGKTVDVAVTGSDAYTFTYDSYLYDGTITVKEIGYTDAQGVYHEGAVPGYQISGAGTAGNDFAITNTHAPEIIQLQAHKVWANGTPKAVTLHLYANGKAIDSRPITLDGTIDVDNTPEFAAWTGAFDGNFYKYENGKLIDYSVTEDSLGGNWSHTIGETGLLNEQEVNIGILFTVTNAYSEPDSDDDIPPVVPNPPIDIPEDPTPTTDLPTEIPDETVPTTDLPDEDVPTADVPKTGDNLMAWIMAAAISGIGLVWLGLTNKKRKDDDAQ